MEGDVRLCQPAQPGLLSSPTLGGDLELRWFTSRRMFSAPAPCPFTSALNAASHSSQTYNPAFNTSRHADSRLLSLSHTYNTSCLARVVSRSDTSITSIPIPSTFALYVRLDLKRSNAQPCRSNQGSCADPSSSLGHLHPHERSLNRRR
ncbi:MAG: hypothetical protein J07HQW2_00659 [Haloquadratum walsbyi J07HQW2]|uniref:Uncharacterized protein n=1 Tax=Haloquadratum walsbyi J07HQW2 TaxID=1238425 RepID=U1NBG4_9EURY|nr:MAG: hypothetical protein J07HQW2_00659 [Haloquadratum walsbyi J07HQW2]